MVAGSRKRAAFAAAQRRSALRGDRASHRRMLGSDHRVFAAFGSICANCHSLIARGARISYDVSAGKFVHTRCARVQRAPPSLHVARSGLDGSSGGIPWGVKRRTRATYSTEWERYAIFAQRQGFAEVPGKDCPWHLPLLWRYMQFRGRTCKPKSITGCLSALAHVGARHGRLLATSKFDADSIMYRRIAMLKNQLAIDFNAKAGGVLFGPNRCTPLGRRAVSVLLSAFAVHDRQSFLRLSRSNRHHLVLCLLQHSAAMRFGHFSTRAYVRTQFNLDSRSGDFTLDTD